MRLLYNNISPYARKTAIFAFEKGVFDQIELDHINVYETEFRNENPLNKIPCLIRDGEPGLFDSYVICDFLDRLGDGPRLIPADGPDRDHVLRLHAIGSGIVDSALILRAQVMRDAKLDTPLPKDWYIDRQWSAIHTACRNLDSELAQFSSVFDLGQIAICCALGYLDTRFPEAAWRHHAPALADWYEVASARDSVKAVSA